MGFKFPYKDKEKEQAFQDFKKDYHERKRAPRKPKQLISRSINKQ